MRTADGDERRFPVRDRAVIGRDSRCHVRIALPTVCERHCELQVIDGELRLNDLESHSGTFHNGRRVRTAVLVDADMLTVGPVTFEVRYQRPVADEHQVQLKPVKEVLDGADDDVPEITVLPKQAARRRQA